MGTGPMAGSAPLPKATVKLAPTQVMNRPSISAPPSAPVKRSAAADAEQFYEEKDPEAGLVPLSVICFVLSALLMVVQMFGSDAIKDDPTGTSPIMVPSAGGKVGANGRQKGEDWETRNAITGAWTNRFIETLPAIP